MSLLQKSWETESDELLDSILTGNSDAEKLGCLGLEAERPFSDTSSDSGMEQQMLSPVEGRTTATKTSPGIDLIDFINGEKSSNRPKSRSNNYNCSYKLQLSSLVQIRTKIRRCGQ